MLHRLSPMENWLNAKVLFFPRTPASAKRLRVRTGSHAARALPAAVTSSTAAWVLNCRRMSRARFVLSASLRSPIRENFSSVLRLDREKLRFFFSSRRRHTRSLRDWSSDVCSSDLLAGVTGISGWIFHLENLLKQLSPVARQQRILMTHGIADPLVPIDKVRPQIPLLK